MFTPRRRNLVAWVALFAVLYAAATPLLAALRAPSQYFGALCTMGGIKALPGSPAVPSESRDSHQPQCVLCVGGTWQPPIDVSLSIAAPAETGLRVQARAGGSLQSAFTALQPLNPRAPPLHS